MDATAPIREATRVIRERPKFRFAGLTAVAFSVGITPLHFFACRFSSCLAISCPLQLHRRTRDRAVGAIHAAITGFRLEQCVAMLAFVVPLTGLGRHRFHLGMAANRAGQQRFQALGVCCCLAHAFHSDGKRRCWARLGFKVLRFAVSAGSCLVFNAQCLADWNGTP